jgi:hypothetical protein
VTAGDAPHPWVRTGSFYQEQFVIFKQNNRNPHRWIFIMRPSTSLAEHSSMMTSGFGLQSLPAKGTELELHDVILYVLSAAISKLPVNAF